MLDWNWYQVVTFGIAVFGAMTGGLGTILGIYNTWYARRKDLPRFQLEAVVERNVDAVDAFERDIGRRVRVRILNTGMIDLYIDGIWLTRSRIQRLLWWRKPEHWRLSQRNRMVRPVFADPIKPGNDLLVTIAPDSLEGALSRGMHTFLARTKTGKAAEFTLDDLGNLEVVNVSSIPPGEVTKRIRVKG
jgi:hypothetical protein